MPRVPPTSSFRTKSFALTRLTVFTLRSPYLPDSLFRPPTTHHHPAQPHRIASNPPTPCHFPHPSKAHPPHHTYV
ncbi:hypothetical protein IQ07DRAFT_582744, partial [Pyrenochaeta sp. DS3sAY3a]